MITYSLTELSDQALLRNLASLVTQERRTTALMLAHIAEVDARKLYLPAAYSSMFDYCLGELGLSEGATYKRLNAARTARRFPEIFLAVEEGRLHVSAVVQLARHLEPSTASELLAAASGKTRAQLEELIAARYPRPDVPERVRALHMQPAVTSQVGVEHIAQLSPDSPAPATTSAAPAAGSAAPAAGSEARVASAEASGAGSQAPTVNFCSGETDNCGVQQLSPGKVCYIIERAKVAPLSPGRYALQVTLSKETREKLRRAQELLGHEVPSGAIADVLDRALDALIDRLEKRKFARTDRPRAGKSSSKAASVNGASACEAGLLGAGDCKAMPGTTRHVPAKVKRAVWQRDQGQCTFVSTEGRRCAARSRLEFDHIDEFARGGQATTERMRLRCRAHNQYGAECTFGVGFMEHKRAQARMGQEREREQRAARQESEAAAQEVIPWLRHLGIRMDEARRAAALCAEIPGATLEARVRWALASLRR